MDELSVYGSCHARVGLLVLRDCGKPAVGGCRQCGRTVCAKHQVEGEEGILCPDCAALQMKDTEEYRRSDRWDDPMWVRTTMYHHYGYAPVYMGESESFTPSEYAVFDAKGEPGAEPSGAMEAGAVEREDEGEWDEGDEVDDSMES